MAEKTCDQDCAESVFDGILQAQAKLKIVFARLSKSLMPDYLLDTDLDALAEDLETLSECMDEMDEAVLEAIKKTEPKENDDGKR